MIIRLYCALHLFFVFADVKELNLAEQLAVGGRRQLVRKNKRRSVFKVPPDEHRSNLRS